MAAYLRTAIPVQLWVRGGPFAACALHLNLIKIDGLGLHFGDKFQKIEIRNRKAS